MPGGWFDVHLEVSPQAGWDLSSLWLRPSPLDAGPLTCAATTPSGDGWVSVLSSEPIQVPSYADGADTVELVSTYYDGEVMRIDDLCIIVSEPLGGD